MRASATPGPPRLPRAPELAPQSKSSQPHLSARAYVDGQATHTFGSTAGHACWQLTGLGFPSRARVQGRSWPTSKDASAVSSDGEGSWEDEARRPPLPPSPTYFYPSSLGRPVASPQLPRAAHIL